MAQHEIQRMLPRHHRMVELALEGLSNVEIASLVGCTPQSVALVLKSPHVQDELARRREKRETLADDQNYSAVQEAKMILERASVKAAQTHVDLLDAVDPSIKQKSANAILDRVYSRNDNARQAGTILIEGDALINLQLAMKESEV